MLERNKSQITGSLGLTRDPQPRPPPHLVHTPMPNSVPFGVWEKKNAITGRNANSMQIVLVRIQTVLQGRSPISITTSNEKYFLQKQHIIPELKSNTSFISCAPLPPHLIGPLNFFTQYTTKLQRSAGGSFRHITVYFHVPESSRAFTRWFLT